MKKLGNRNQIKFIVQQAAKKNSPVAATKSYSVVSNRGKLLQQEKKKHHEMEHMPGVWYNGSAGV